MTNKLTPVSFGPAPFSFFNEMPNDLIPVIFSFLSRLRDLCNLSQTSKEFNCFYNEREIVKHCLRHCQRLFKKLKKPGKKYAEACLACHLTSIECVQSGLPTSFAELREAHSLLRRAKFNQTGQAALKQNCEKALKEFGAVFVENLAAMKIAPKYYGILTKLARHIIKSSFDKETSNRANNIKKDSAIKNANYELLGFVIGSYCDLPIEDITCQSFQQQVALLIQSFAKIDSIDLELMLRKRILVKYGEQNLKAASKRFQEQAENGFGFTQIASFYNELSVDVNENNKGERSKALHKIID